MPRLWCLALVAIMASGGGDGGGRAVFAAPPPEPPPASTHLRIGVALLDGSGYHAWLDAESIVAALIQPATLRASIDTTWSFEVFCAQTSATSLSTTTRARGCPRQASAGTLGALASESSVMAGETLGAWTARLDRLITLGAAPPPDLCAELSARRAVASSPAAPDADGARASPGDSAQRDGENTEPGEAGSVVCFHLPDCSLMSQASSWPLWHAHTMRTTEVQRPCAHMPHVPTPQLSHTPPGICET